MSKEIEKKKKIPLVQKEQQENLKIALISAPVFIYLISMVVKLDGIKNFMEQSGYTYFAESNKNLLEIIQQLDFLRIPGGAYSLEQLTELQFAFQVALAIMLLSTIAYGTRSLLRQHYSKKSGSKLLQSYESNSGNLDQALTNLSDNDEPLGEYIPHDESHNHLSNTLKG